ncbi:MAG TPA: TonB-dependent receptor plug domain-containing protein [Bacteroidales bacterium]|nr:TonB-dependent receptor plug domain-containing protein [Bacteroidales bacterium]
MGDLLVYILKSSLCLAVFYLFYKTMLSRETLHKFNRIVLLSLFVVSLILPFIEVSFQKAAPYSGLSLNLEALLAMAQASGTGEEVAAPANNWLLYLVVVYLAGVVFSVIKVGISFYKMFSLLKSRGTKREIIEHNVRLIIHKRDSAPFSWMRYIAISEKDYAESGKEIITHELAHISRKHSIDLLLAESVKIIHWFNPAAYLLKQELQNIHEYEADEAVINKGIDAKQYQLLLIKKAVGDRLYTIANSFNHSKLKNRITMISKKKSPKWAAVKAMFLLPLSMFAVAAFATEEASTVFKPVSEIKITDFIQKDTIKVKKDVKVFVMKNKSDSASNIKVSTITSEMGDSLNVLVFVDGVEKDMDALKEINSKEISEVRVLKNEKAMKQYGEKAKDGVIVVTTKVINTNGEKNVNSNANIVINMKEGMDKALYVVDGIKQKGGDLNKIDPNTIATVDVLKGEAATRLYGDDAKNGVVIISTKSSDSKGDTWTVKSDKQVVIKRENMDTTVVKNTIVIKSKSLKDANPLYVVDGKVMKNFDEASLDPDNIKSMSVLKGDIALKKYGDKAKNGVIEITLKK